MIKFNAIISGNLAVDPLLNGFYLQNASPAIRAGVTIFAGNNNIGALGKKVSKAGRQAVLI